MNGWQRAVGVGLLLAAGGCTMRGSDPGTAVLEAERAFSRLSVEKGMKEAFLGFLAGDAVVFRPGPVPAPAWFAARPSPPGTLIWEPAISGTAASGDLAVNAGPWEYRDGAEKKVTGAGWFVSVWRREEAGWKVALDAGISLEDVRLSGAPVERLAGFSAADGGGGDRESLDRAERGLAAPVGPGAVEALAAMSAPDVLTFRNGAPPGSGIGDLRRLATEEETGTQRIPEGARISEGGDFGYTWGRIEREPGEEGEPSAIAGGYLRVWRRGAGAWRVALDLVSL